MRPKTIVYFERIIFGTLLLGVLQSYLDWNALEQATRLDNNPSVAKTLTLLIFIFVVIGTLTLLVSRRRSKIAMWVSIALFILGLVFFVQSITELGSNIIVVLQAISNGSSIIVVLQTIGKGVAYALLFTPSARRWMRPEDEKPA